jgi:hypothetical protein
MGRDAKQTRTSNLLILVMLIEEISIGNGRSETVVCTERPMRAEATSMKAWGVRILVCDCVVMMLDLTVL